jgi:hypothetical protein
MKLCGHLANFNIVQVGQILSLKHFLLKHEFHIKYMNFF